MDKTCVKQLFISRTMVKIDHGNVKMVHITQVLLEVSDSLYRLIFIIINILHRLEPTLNSLAQFFIEQSDV